MNLSEILKQTEQFLPMLINLGVGVVVFVVGWIVSKWVNRVVLSFFRRREMDESLARFLAQLAQYAVLVASVLTALEKAGAPVASFLAVLASAGLAIGLALQGSLANFASGVMILFFRPFSLNDFVSVGGHTGTVADIGLFATTLTSPDNEKIILPNSGVTSGSLVNHSVNGIRRGQIDIGIAYDADVPKAMEVMISAAVRARLTLVDPVPQVAFVEFGASSLNFKVFAWSKSEDYLAMLHEVKVAIHEDLKAAQIEIPFNQLVIHHAA